MSFDVEMPDGTTIQDVPDGTTRSQVMALYSKGTGGAAEFKDSNVAPEKKYDATEGNSFGENLLVGAGQGLHHIAQRASNIAGHAVGADYATDPSGWASDQAIKDREDTDKDIEGTAGGKIGRIGAEVLATLPLGAGVGKGLGLASDALAGGGRAAQLASGALGSGVGQAAVEGAATNRLTSDDPDALLQGAGMGAALGIAGKVLKRTLGGIVQKSAGAGDLEHLAGQQGRDIFIPVSRAADDAGDIPTKFVRTLYREGLPLVPTVGGRLEKQTSNAKQVVRDMVAGESDPANVMNTAVTETDMARRQAMKKAFDREYESTVKNYDYPVAHDFRDQVTQRIEAAMPGVDSVTKNKIATLVDRNMQRFSDGRNQISGSNLLNARQAGNNSFGELAGPEKEAFHHANGIYDDIVHDTLSSGTQGMQADLDAYKNLSEPYKNFKVYGKAVNAAKRTGGEFEPSQLAAAANPDKNPGLYNLGVTANKVLGGNTGHGSFALRTAAHGAGIFSAFTHPVATAATVLVGHGLASETVQRALMGDTAAQQSVSNLLKVHPELAANLSRAMKQYATSGIGE